MLARSPRRDRRAATMAETAIVLSLLMMLMIGLIVMGMGTVRYQQVAGLAREAARYGSVRGASYKSNTGSAMATPATIYTNAILPMSTGLDTTKLSYSVVWDNANQGPVYLSDPTTNKYTVNYITVTVSYQWQSESFPGFSSTTRTLTSTSRIPMSY